MVELVDAFVSREVRLMPVTRSHHRSTLRRACDSWESQGCRSPGDLGADILVGWAVARGRMVGGGVLHADVGLVRRFLRWLVGEGYLLSDPMPEWLCRGRGPGAGVRAVPSESAVRSMLSRAASGQHPLRDSAITEVVYGCGLRRCELVGLDLSDWREDTLRVRGKGGHVRLVPVGRVATAALRAYVDGERLAMLRRWNPCERALFVSGLGRRMSTQSIGALFQRCQAGLTPHQLRHACATHMLRNGANIVVLKELLGHKSIVTTRIYTEVKVEDMRKGLERYHPRGLSI